MISLHRQIQEDTYFKLMRIQQENPDLTQRELTQKLGLSLGGLNYSLKALIYMGWVKMQNFQNSKNKFKYVFFLTPQGIAERVAMTSRFLGRKMQEYEALMTEIKSLRQDAGKQETLKAP
jgi:EPS-associated MarR family transcriptional regulator